MWFFPRTATKQNIFIGLINECGIKLGKSHIEGRVFPTSNILTCTKLKSFHLPMLAVCLGNDYVTYDELKYIHKSILKATKVVKCCNQTGCADYFCKYNHTHKKKLF